MQLIQKISKFASASRLGVFALTCSIFMLTLPQVNAATQSKKTTSTSTKKSASSAKRLVATHSSSRKKIKTAVKTTRKTEALARQTEVNKPSFGQIAGLHDVVDPLELKSSVAYVVDQDTHEVLLSKNDHAVLPIASLTKLMTGLLIAKAQLPMDEFITITQDDVDTEKWSRSRIKVGTTLTRTELLHLALMASENRAANALGRTYPGGVRAFVLDMNRQAQLLGMRDTHYVEPTGLSSKNQSSARDLAILVNEAYGQPVLRQLTTSPSHEVEIGQKTLLFNNTNSLVTNPSWDIGLQKTGYISEAGRCLVMQASIAGRKLIMVFLDSAGKLSRIGDAQRVRSWVESGGYVNNLSPQLIQDFAKIR